MYTYVLVHTGMYWSVRWCTSTYWYILVCTSIYQYVPVHTSIYWYVPVRTSTSLSLAALFCGRHDMVQGSTDHIMKCHDIVHTDRYRLILTCTDKRQVYRILREMALYWPVLKYILVYTCFWAVHVSTRPFLLESYTPDACRYRSVLVGIYYIMTFDDMVWYGLYSLVPCHGSHKIKLPKTMMY
jgi:hypothetical protein